MNSGGSIPCRRMPRRLGAVMIAALLVLVGCSSGTKKDAVATGTRPTGTNITIRVPAQAPSISAAVKLARPGDLVLIAPGTYHESVNINTPKITLRGESRDKVVIDGQLRQANAIVVTAPGVAVENLTVTNNTQNGILVTGSAKAAAGAPGQHGGYDTAGEPVSFLKSFLISYVTASNNGLYGLYVFSAQDGVVENSYASGGADSGIYVGQCKPCNVLVRNNIAELNAVGFEGTNASQDIVVTGNRLVGNRVGLTSDSDHQEQLLPQQGALIIGNLIGANDQPQTPQQADGGFGIGVGIDGGSDNQVTRNRIIANSNTGLVITASADIPPLGNAIVGNIFTGNGLDVGWTFPSLTVGKGNCLLNNTMTTTMPADLAISATCPMPATTTSPTATLSGKAPPPGIPFTQVAAPPVQPQMPAATTSGATTVPAMPTLPDASSIQLPEISLLAATARIAVS